MISTMLMQKPSPMTIATFLKSSTQRLYLKSRLMTLRHRRLHPAIRTSRLNGRYSMTDLEAEQKVRISAPLTHGQSQREATKSSSQFWTVVLITHTAIWQATFGFVPTTSLLTKIANSAPSRTSMVSMQLTTALTQWTTTATAHTAPESSARKAATTSALPA